MVDEAYGYTVLRSAGRPSIVTMANLLRAKKLDIGCWINNKIIRDHTKRKVFEDNEALRYGMSGRESPHVPVDS